MAERSLTHRIFKSTDAGLKWQPVFDDQSVASIGALAVARSDANVVSRRA